MGYMSNSYHLNCNLMTTIFDVILAGFWDTSAIPVHCTKEQTQDVYFILDYFNLTHLQNVNFIFKVRLRSL